MSQVEAANSLRTWEFGGYAHYSEWPKVADAVIEAVSHLFFYQLVLVALVWLCLMLHWAWPSDPAAVCPTTAEPPGPLPKRHRAPTPFAGLTTKPPCDACEHRGD